MEPDYVNQDYHAEPPTLSQNADDVVCCLSTTSALFRDFGHLGQLATDWELLRQKLQLPGKAANVTRGQIEKKLASLELMQVVARKSDQRIRGGNADNPTGHLPNWSEYLLTHLDGLKPSYTTETSKCLFTELFDCVRNAFSITEIEFQNGLRLLEQTNLVNILPSRYPKSFANLQNILFDKDQVPDLWYCVRVHSQQALNDFARCNCGSGPPDLDDVILEFMELKAFRIFKNARAYLNSSKGSLNWAPCVFNSFKKDARHALNYAMNRTANRAPDSKSSAPAHEIAHAADLKARAEAQGIAETADGALAHEKQRKWVREALADITEDQRKTLRFASDKNFKINHDECAEFEAKNGWLAGTVHRHCAELKEMILLHATIHGVPPGMKERTCSGLQVLGDVSDAE